MARASPEKGCARGRNSGCCDDVRRVAIERKLQLESKIRRMKTMSATLDRLIAACAAPTVARNCARLRRPSRETCSSVLLILAGLYLLNA